MDLNIIISQVFLLVYAGLLGLVAPWIGFSNKSVGSLVPMAIAVIWSSVVSTLLILLSVGYDNPLNLTAVMLSMPVAMWLGTKLVAARSAKQPARR